GRETVQSHMFSLEDFKLVPGDVISYYARAKDFHQSTQTDMYFLEVRPYEMEYRQGQSQGGGGGGGGGGQQADDSANLVRRQKDIIAATFNLLRDSQKKAHGSGDDKSSIEDMKTLAAVQKRL